MTKDALIKLINTFPKGSVILISGDDGVTSTYAKVGESVTEEDFISFGDGDIDECLITHGTILNKVTGLRDIPVTIYRSLTVIRNIMVLDNPDDKDKINVNDLYAI